MLLVQYLASTDTKTPTARDNRVVILGLRVRVVQVFSEFRELWLQLLFWRTHRGSLKAGSCPELRRGFLNGFTEVGGKVQSPRLGGIERRLRFEFGQGVPERGVQPCVLLLRERHRGGGPREGGSVVKMAKHAENDRLRVCCQRRRDRRQEKRNGTDSCSARVGTRSGRGHGCGPSVADAGPQIRGVSPWIRRHRARA
jgi:hypothetical protein